MGKPTWSQGQVERLRALLASGLSHAQAAKALGLPRNAVCGAVRRHIRRIPDSRTPEQRNRKRGRKSKQPRTWTAAALTETWAARKARLAEERAR